jgi:acetyltransferase-like isoleucine patch superfamily enzyme
VTSRRDFFVHPAGLCDSWEVGDGTKIWAFAHVLAGAVIGADCNICDGAFVEDGARIGDRVTVKNGALIWAGVTIHDDVFLGPGVVFTNDLRPRAHRHLDRDELVPTVVGRGATIGANATIVCGSTIGGHAFVAAGAVVVDDVGAHALVAGNPARQLGWVCRCGERLDDALRCGSCRATYAAAAGGLGLLAVSVRTG